MSCFVLCGIVSGQTETGDKKHGSNKNSSVEFLTDIYDKIEAAGAGGNYNSKLTRELQFDVLRIKRWFIHFGVQERTLLDHFPKQFNHDLEYLEIGREFANGRIRLFWDHTCNNPGRKLPEDKRSDIHWNECGIGYETNSMRLGHKSDGIKFDSGSEWLNSLNWRISLSKIWMKEENDYEYMLKFGIRNDIFRNGRQIFYTQLGLNSIWDERGITLNPSVEFGDRIHLDNICLTPFLSYEHFFDWYKLDEGEKFFFYGLRLEMDLNQKNNIPEYISWKPEFHVKGDYTNLVAYEDYGHSNDFAINSDLLKIENKILSLDTYTGFLAQHRSLIPKIINYRLGFSLKIENLRIFYSYSTLYGIEQKSCLKNYNLIGMEIKKDASFWNLSAQAGIYPSTYKYDYQANLQGNIVLKLFSEGITPYINSSFCYLQGDNSVFGSVFEAGLRIPGKAGIFSIYLRLQENSDIFRFGKGNFKINGIRFEF